jgi:hypothetical protein
LISNMQRSVCCLLCTFLLVNETTAVVFNFKRYSFKRKPKFERPYRNQEKQCQESPECMNLTGLEKVKCARMCVSKACYDEIYLFDEVIPGSRKGFNVLIN